MAKYNFTADYGVEFGEHEPADRAGIPGPYQVWAKFERDRDLDTPTGAKVFTFGTDNPAIADRVRGVDDYGIREVEADLTEPAIVGEPELDEPAIKPAVGLDK